MQDPLHMFMTTESNYEPLTPSHLIYGRRITTNPNSSHHEVVSTNRSLTRQARHHKLLLEQFIKQWRTEYLTSLREQISAMASIRGSGSSISEGDIAIVKGDSTPRAFWRLAQVEQLLPGKDGKTRSAIIMLGGCNSGTVRRPIELIVPIEVRSKLSDNSQTKEVLAGQEHTTSDKVTEGRSQRTSAIVGEFKRRDGVLQ